MSDPYIDQKFGEIVGPHINKGVADNLSRYLEAANRHEVSERAAAYVMSKLWVDEDRYRARTQPDHPPEPPARPGTGSSPA